MAKITPKDLHRVFPKLGEKECKELVELLGPRMNRAQGLVSLNIIGKDLGLRVESLRVGGQIIGTYIDRHDASEPTLIHDATSDEWELMSVGDFMDMHYDRLS